MRCGFGCSRSLSRLGCQSPASINNHRACVRAFFLAHSALRSLYQFSPLVPKSCSCGVPLIFQHTRAPRRRYVRKTTRSLSTCANPGLYFEKMVVRQGHTLDDRPVPLISEALAATTCVRALAPLTSPTHVRSQVTSLGEHRPYLLVFARTQARSEIVNARS